MGLCHNFLKTNKKQNKWASFQLSLLIHSAAFIVTLSLCLCVAAQHYNHDGVV